MGLPSPMGLLPFVPGAKVLATTKWAMSMEGGPSSAARTNITICISVTFGNRKHCYLDQDHFSTARNVEDILRCDT